MPIRSKKPAKHIALLHTNALHNAPNNLARWVLAAYALLLMYASLHPLDALRATEANPLAYLDTSRLFWSGGKPYGVGSFDALSNFLAYLPLGLGAAWALSQRLVLGWAALLALALSVGLSLSLEALQTYHPLRVPSLWDVFINTLGAALGVLMVSVLRFWSGWTRFAPATLIAPHAGAVWAVLGLWSVAQLHPQSWVFVTAPLRGLWNASEQGFLELPLANLDGAALVQLETMVASLALFCALGLLRLGSRFAGQGVLRRMAWMLAGLGLLVAWQGVAYAIQYGSDASLALWGGGVWTACWIAAASAMLLALLPTPPAAALTVAALGAYLTVVQWLPPHPYAVVAALWQYGRFTHLFGLTAAVSALWPALALAALVLQLRYFGRDASAT